MGICYADVQPILDKVKLVLRNNLKFLSSHCGTIFCFGQEVALLYAIHI